MTLLATRDLGPLIQRAIDQHELDGDAVEVGGTKGFYTITVPIRAATATGYTDLAYTSAGRTFQVTGRKLIFLRNQSNPAARLLVKVDGGQFFLMAPGSNFVADKDFTNITIRMSALSLNSALVGAGGVFLGFPGPSQVAMLIVPANADYDEVIDSKPAWAPVSLMGDILGSPGADVSLNYFNTGTRPDAVGGSGFFPIAGLSRLRVFLDFTLSGGTPGAFTLIPWVGMQPDPTGTAVASYWEMAASAVPYVNGVNYQKKACLLLDLAQLYPGRNSAGNMMAFPGIGLEVRDDAGTLTAATQVGCAVQGVE